MRSQRGSRLESVFVPRHGRRLPSALSLLAISVCILVAALLFGVAAPPPAQAVDIGSIIGMVTDTSAVGVGDIWVAAFQADGQGGWNFINGANTVNTASDGTIGSYDLGGLPA